MIIDTSALIAVFKGEDRAREIATAAVSAEALRISAATLVELTAVVAALREAAAHDRVAALLADWQVETVPVDATQAALAQQAYRDYGRGSGHPAKLNLGDCYSYALARARDEPLLYVGNDFVHTGIRSAL